MIFPPFTNNPIAASMAFSLNLNTSLVPEYAQGSGTPTFTRASVADHIDFEGLHRSVLSGEARFQGSRRVWNRLDKSEDISTWSSGGSLNVTLTPTTAVFTDASAYVYGRTTGGTYVTGATAQASVTLSSPDGKAVVGLRMNFVGVGNATQISVPLTTTPTRYVISTTALNSTTGVDFGLDNRVAQGGDGTTSGTVVATHWQVETVTGQTNQNPSEYVSVGVLSAPYHGANVDGVKYFSTLNGNTVSSNVVTEATGAAINSSQGACAGGVTAKVVDASGPLGYLAEGARTNDILQSNTLGTTWTVSNASNMNAVAADAYVSVDGTTTMDKLQPKATSAVHSLDQAFTFTAAKYTTAVDLRYVPATPQRWVALIMNDGTTTWGASFDLLNGVVGAVSAGATSGIEATALANVYRVWVTNTANAAAAAGTVKISLNATDTATLENAARAGTETLGAGMVQHEVGTFKSSRITTTTVAVARPADVDQGVSSGNVPTNDFAVYGETAFNPVPTSASYYLWSSYVDANNSTSVLWDGTNLIARKRISGTSHDATIALTPSAGTVVKWAARFTSTTGTDIFLNGTKGTNDTTNTACQIGAAFQINADGNGANQPYATDRFSRIWISALPDGVLKVLTT